MKKKCDRCDKPAPYHSVEIIKGQKIETNLCEEHALEAGMATQPPINQLLTNFVKLHSGSPAATQELVCDECGTAFSKFRENSLLGCPSCYKAFETPLVPLIERAHEGGAQHVGKAPRRAGAGEQRQLHLQRMRKRLAEAVASEDYKLAARLRDEIRRSEGQPS